MTADPPPLEKVTINLTRPSAEALDKIIQSTGDTKTGAINRALQLYAWMQEQFDTGANLYIKDAGGQAERLKFL
jgi:hypothetical protein